MKLIRCEKGHMYNCELHKECPYCNSTNSMINIVEEKREAIILKSENKTEFYWIKESNISPVVGWLVCISGLEKGKDYRLVNERNFIGRSDEMQIQLNDINISRKNHASITYNPKQRIFVLSPGESSSIIYLQGKALYETKQIFNQDIIEIGQNKFIFISLCGDNFDWNL